MTAPARLYPLRPHPAGEALSNTSKRFVTVPAGRRSGKTERFKRKLIKSAIRAHGRMDHAFFAGAPTRDQAKRVFWNDLKAMMPPVLVKDVSESNLIITLRTNTIIAVVGMDKPQRIEGVPWDGGGLDEFADMKPTAFEENVRPALSDRKGWCWLLGVPEGRNHYYDLDHYARSGVDPEWGSYSWPSSDVIDPAEIASARRTLDPLVFQQEYEASFVNFLGRAYYAYDSERHVGPLYYDERAPLIFCFDFNVDPGVAVICQEQLLPSGEIGTGVIGEVWIPRNSTTPAVCRKIMEDWGAHEGEVRCYGDPAGGARHTTQVRGSDWDIIKQELPAAFGDRLTFYVPRAAPAERARINAVNSRAYQRRLYVDPAEAPHTLKDLEGVRLLEGGSGELDKKHDRMLTHLSDGLGYYIAKEFPIVPNFAGASSFRM